MATFNHDAPQTTAAEMLQALHERMLASTWAADNLLDDVATEDMIYDVVEAIDKDRVQHKFTAQKTLDLRKMLMPQNQRAVSKMYIKKLKKQRLPSGTLTIDDQTAMLRTKQGIERWWNSVVGDMAFIDKHRPPAGAITKDNANGRFLVPYPGFARKSISWTQRTMDVAAVETLKLAWDCHFKKTGIACPHPLVVNEGGSA